MPTAKINSDEKDSEVTIRDSPQTMEPTHWSKEIVEHLRTVHFALIATAVAVIVVAQTAKPYNRLEADRELNQIQQLKLKWSPEFIKSTAEKQVIRSRVPSLGTDLDELVTETAMGDVLYVKSNGQLYVAKLPKDNWRVGCPTTTYRISITDVPDLICDFREWWDKLGDGCSVLFPNKVYGAKIAGFGMPEATADVIAKEEIISKGTPKTTNETVETDLKLQCETPYCGDNVTLEGQLDLGRRIVIPIASKTIFRVDRQPFSSFLSGTNLNFGQAFGELNALSDVTGKRTFSELRTELAIGSDAVVFEAFGVKFPEKLVTTAGILSILSVQLYLFAYLHRRRGTLKKNAPGREVLWIGMDTTLLGRLIFFVTVSILPVLSMAFLIGSEGRFVRLFSIGLIPGWNRTEYLLVLVAMVISASLCVLCWKSRPKVSPEPNVSHGQE